MTDWSKIDGGDNGTWAAFIVYARDRGANIEILEDVSYADGKTCVVEVVRRWDGKEYREYPLPRYCTPDQTLRLLAMESACRILKIPKIPGWTMQ